MSVRAQPAYRRLKRDRAADSVVKVLLGHPNGSRYVNLPQLRVERELNTDTLRDCTAQVIVASWLGNRYLDVGLSCHGP